MNILSFSSTSSESHSAAALVCDGVLVAAAEEERFSRVKHDGHFPVNAIDYCLRQASMSLPDIDLIAIPGKPFRTGPNAPLAQADMSPVRALVASGKLRRRVLVHKLALDVLQRMHLPFPAQFGMHSAFAASLQQLRVHHDAPLPPIRYLGHHLCHAAATYLTSGLNKSAVVTVDGQGDLDSCVTWKAAGNGFQRLRHQLFSNSLGWFYWECTRYLGLGDFGEGKTMGLAAYGRAEACAQRVAALLDESDVDWYRYRARPNPELLGFAPAEGDVLAPPYPDFAAACQQALERAVRTLGQSATGEAGCHDLCLGGGVALNCSANGALLESGTASSVWVFPAAGDNGLSVGAALLCAAEAGELSPGRLPHAYWGPEFDSSAYEQALRHEPRVSYRRAGNIAAEVAELLAEGEVVGWFQGRMELGPRALGNRSILADPRDSAVRDRVNKLKGREHWRPLAPSVLAERCSEFFALRQPSPFMLFAAQVHEDKRRLVPAIVHVDGSARPQTVTREQNPKFYELIRAFESATGIPLVLNTSFNADSEPIVCTPEDAIRTFLALGIDALVLGDFVVRTTGDVVTE